MECGEKGETPPLLACNMKEHGERGGIIPCSFAT
jgi:hypothetical protein